MFNKIKKQILNLLGIEVIIPKGEAYITFKEGGYIKIFDPPKDGPQHACVAYNLELMGLTIYREKDHSVIAPCGSYTMKAEPETKSPRFDLNTTPTERAE